MEKGNSRNMTLLLVTLVALLIMVPSVQLKGQGSAGTTGTDLLEQCTLALENDLHRVNQAPAGLMKAGVCMGYVQGVADNYDGCCPVEAVTVGQNIKVVVKYLNDHPEKLHLDRADLTRAALKEAFPCSK